MFLKCTKCTYTLAYPFNCFYVSYRLRRPKLWPNLLIVQWRGYDSMTKIKSLFDRHGERWILSWFLAQMASNKASGSLPWRHHCLQDMNSRGIHLNNFIGSQQLYSLCCAFSWLVADPYTSDRVTSVTSRQAYTWSHLEGYQYWILLRCMENWAPCQYSIKRPIVRSRKVSKPGDW